MQEDRKCRSIKVKEVQEGKKNRRTEVKGVDKVQKVGSAGVHR